MFRMIRLLAYLSLGYLVYEIYQGLNNGLAEAQPDSGHELRSTGRMSVIGSGRGQSATTYGSAGESQHHTVGRGVTP